ncbi:MAG TPA: Mov34/MPN/PAD-1 family protein [Candidatus Limnocylindrales bacterium]|nr:Mov34/MPN/PAD-1 family protein [Candidatus Limnocylindrales bacterium]
MGQAISLKNIQGKWKSNDGQYTVYLANTCLKKMLMLALDHNPCEVGTSLIGYYALHGFDAYITDIAPLPSDSKGSRFTFFRGINGLKKFFEKLNGVHYLGEWHSHPCGRPNPSDQDIRSQFAIANDKLANCSEGILVIIGGELKFDPQITICVISRESGLIKLIPEDE